MNEQVHRASVVIDSNRALGPGVHEITFRHDGAGIPPWRGALPGQFAMVRCPGTGVLGAGGPQLGARSEPEGRASAEFEPLLARPLAFMRADESTATFGVKVYGRGSAAIAGSPVGTKIVMWGPLGQEFTHAKSEAFVLVGGGIGVPPLVMQAERLLKNGQDLRAVIVGARTKAELFGRAQLEKLGLAPKICTDDGSDGHKGFVTALLEKEPLRSGIVVQTCGPTPMMKAVAAIAEKAGVRCEMSLEARMGCGVGACRGCMVATSPAAKAPGGRFEGKEYLCLCLDGPAVNSTDIDLQRLGH